MAIKNNDFFSLKEIALSALKAMGKLYNSYDYRTIFHSASGRMEDTKMFECLVYNERCYEFKFTRRRDPIEDALAPFEGIRDKIKTEVMKQYYSFIKDFYPILKIQTTRDRIFVRHCGFDYEILFTEKRGLKLDE